MFKDKAGEFRWYLRANNGEIIADSSEGYVNKRSALHGIDLIKEMNPETVKFEDLTATAEVPQAATAGATAVAGMTAEPAPTEEVTIEAPPVGEAPMAAEVAMEPTKDKRGLYSVIIVVVAAIVIVGVVVAGFMMGLLM